MSTATDLQSAILEEDTYHLIKLVEQGADVNALLPDGQTPLHLAASHYKLGAAVHLLENGADPDAISPATGETPLMACARQNDNGTAWFILRHNPDPDITNAQGQTALDIAKALGHERLAAKLDFYISTRRYTHFEPEQIANAARLAPLGELERLLREGADPNRLDADGHSPLYLVFCQDRDIDARVRLLLNHGADIYRRNRYGISDLSNLIRVSDCPREKDSLVNMMQGYDVNRLDARGCNFLHYACYIGFDFTVKDLLRLGADPAIRTASGFLPIEISMARLEDPEATGWHEPIIQLLRPLSPEPRHPLPRRLGHELMLAAWRGDAPAMRELLQAGAPVEGDDWGMMSPTGLEDTPLLALPLAKYENDALTQEDFAEMTRMLVDAGADLLHSDDEDNTPLHRAVSYNLPGMVRVLLEAGADVTAENVFDGPPLNIARKHNLPDMALLLENWMRDHGIPVEC